MSQSDGPSPMQRLRHIQSQPAMRSQSPLSSSSSSSKSSSTTTLINRTQHKLLLQRQSFLADDKDYLDHPANMRRLTKELDRVNREYRSIRYFEDPMADSFRRVVASHPHLSLRRASAQECFSSQQPHHQGFFSRLWFGSSPPKRHDASSHAGSVEAK